MRLNLILIALLASAGAAQAADRYGSGQSDAEASRQAYGEPAPSNRVLNWSQKAPPPSRQQVDAYGHVRPEPLSAWARRADAQRSDVQRTDLQHPDRMSTPVQGQIIPRSSYTMAATGVAPAPAARPGLPTSLYSPAPTSALTPAPAPAYRTAPRPKGAAIEVDPDALPNQPTIAQQMASEEAAVMQDAKIARAQALGNKAVDNATKTESALVPSQDAVR